jgi:hypothetical protein
MAGGTPAMKLAVLALILQTYLMTRQILLIFIAMTTLIGCDNFSNKIQEDVNSSVNDAKAEMNKDVTNAKTALTIVSKKVWENSADTIVTTKIKTLYSSINLTSKYIDSLKMEMNKLDDKDLNNIDLIKKIYLYDGVGDSLFNKVKASYVLTIDIALYDTTKSRLTKVHDTFTDENKKNFFELTNPLGVNMILYGIESELIKDGVRCLYGYPDETKSTSKSYR